MGASITVTFDGNGGGVPDPISVVIPLPALVYGSLAVVSREGYAFLGWYTQASGGYRVTAMSSLAQESDHALYARWREVITVTLDANGGDPPVPLSIDYSDFGAYGAALAGAVVGRTGYAFAGWYTGVLTGSLVTPESDIVNWADHTLYARWVAAVVSPIPVEDYWGRTGDGDWVYFKANVLAANLPPALKAAYDAWLTEEEREYRLDFITDGVVLDYRGAVEAENHPVGGLDPALIPMPCLRSAQMMVWYFLAIECGYADSAVFRQGWQDAEVYLRSLLMATRTGNNRFAAGAGAGGTPMYSLTSSSAGSAPSPQYSGGGGSTVPVNYSLGMGL